MFIVWIFITDAVLALIVSSVGAADESSTIFYLLGFGFVALMTYRLYRNQSNFESTAAAPQTYYVSIGDVLMWIFERPAEVLELTVNFLEIDSEMTTSC